MTASFTVLLTLFFLIFQYNRESYYKTELLNSKLQQINTHIADLLEHEVTADEILAHVREQEPNLRLTLIDTLGRVVYDSEVSTNGQSLPNHLDRWEIEQALTYGEGHTIRRHSQSVERDYFYSAQRSGSVIVRSALPYDFSLSEALSVNYQFLSYIVAIGLVIILFGYLITLRLSKNIRHLREFTLRLDRGEVIENEPRFADDELGEVANHIVYLYSQLQRAVSDAEREHQVALEQERDKVRLKRQLSNNINHELKTPISVIMGYMESIMLNPDIDPQTRERFIERSYDQTKRLERLMNDLSVITRIDEAPTLIQCEECDLRKIIDEAAEECLDKSFEIELRLPESMPIYGNQPLLSSIFLNLMSNAVSYSAGNRIEITLTAESAEGYRITFADNGVGVEPKHLLPLFERFYRVDKGRSRKMGGTGLGLAIVKNSVLFHGGSIVAQNRKQGGLEFDFTLMKHKS